MAPVLPGGRPGRRPATPTRRAWPRSSAGRCARTTSGWQYRRRSPPARRRSWRTPLRRSPRPRDGRSSSPAFWLPPRPPGRHCPTPPTRPGGPGSPARPGLRCARTWRPGCPATCGRAIGLLRPLAYAQGTGLPWEDIWAMLATALDSRPAVHQRGSAAADRTCGCLRRRGWHHRRPLPVPALPPFADRVPPRRPRPARRPADHHHRPSAARANALQRPPRLASRPPLRSRAYLAAHAAAGGMIDDLAQDPGFLLAASPARLLDALDPTTSEPARAAADAYRRAVPFLRAHHAPSILPTLRLAARCGRAPALADRITADGLTSPWRPSMGILATAPSPSDHHRPYRVRVRGGGGGAGWPPVVISGSATGRCGCGTWPPAPRSATRSPATPGT